MKVLFMTNVPSPYRVDFFNELGKYCDLTVTFEKNTSSERDSSWLTHHVEHFKAVFLKGVSVRADIAACPGIIRYVKDTSFDHIICGNYASPTGMLAIQYMKSFRIPFWFEGDGGFAKSGKGPKEWIKRYFISAAKGYFSTAEEYDKYCLTYGAKPDQIYRYPFTSLYEKDILSAPPTQAEKQVIRNELGICEEYVVLSVGQIIHRKGVDILIQSAANYPDDTGVYIVGGKPPKEYLDMIIKFNVKNIHFVDFQSKTSLKQYYQAADILVLPTREDIWGLVINEAMAQGLPVITTDRCIAGLELLKNNMGGYIVPVDDCVALAKQVNVILGTLELRNQLSLNALDRIRNYTIEKMAEIHLQILHDCE